MLRAVTIVNGSTVRCVQSVQRIAAPLVNASSWRRMILRTMRRERSRGSQFMNVATDAQSAANETATCEDLRSMPCPVGAGRNARSVGRGGERRECHEALT